MRILDNDKDEKLNNIILFLTKAEALRLRDSLNVIIDNPSKHHHSHIPSEDYLKEITVCTYDTEHLDSFDERSRKLILEDV